MDGKIVIGTEIDSKQLETDLKKLTAKFQKLESQADSLQKRKIELEVKLKDTYKKEIDEIVKEYDDVVNKEFEFASKSEPTYGRKAPQKFMDWVDPIYQKRLDEVNRRYQSQITALNNINAKLKENAEEQNKIKGSVDSITSKLENTKGLDAIKAGMGDINKSLTTTIKKIGRWALAVFGVRSAYLFVRNAVNTIANEDEQLKADIEAVRVALAYTIEPLVRGIVNLMKTLMGYVAYIVKAWSGRDIFAKSAKSLANASKSAKELQKSSLSFDKFNKLGGGNAGSGGGGVTAGLQTPEDADVPKWIKWIAENKNLVIGALTGIALALLAIKLANPATLFAVALGLIIYLVAEIVKHWGEIKDLLAVVWDYTKAFFKGLLDTILSIIDSALSVVNGVFTTLIEILKAPFVIAFETVKGVFKGIVETVKGVFQVIKGIFIGDWKAVMDGFKQIFKGAFDSLWSIAKAPLNLIIDGINSLIKGANKIQFDMPSWIPGVGGKKFGINIKTIPRLERGGIVHNPGSGVMMGSYIAGEGRNPEAVIPLDDATLDRLGQAIARHSQINATIVNEMDGRVLSKNLAKINNENVFARNGGY